MRTTLDIPEDLMAEAQTVTRLKSKTDVVILCLEELIRRRKVEELRNLRGNIEFPHLDAVLTKRKKQ